MNKKNIVVFSGAGLDKESGVSTFRDSTNGLWYNYKVEEVATIDGWKKDRLKVLDFHNKIRSLLPTVQPNKAHLALAKLEKEYNVVNITQNVSDLLERGGSTNILHLHGELTKARSCFYDNKTSPLDEVIEIGYKDINLGDKCPNTGSQLRPHIVWFGEYPFNIIEAYEALAMADILLIIGTSLQITYTLDMLKSVKEDAEIYYIDPNPVQYLTDMGMNVKYITKTAVEGVDEIVNKLLIKPIE